MLRGAYRLDASLNATLDQVLTDSLNKEIAEASGGNSQENIRSAFIFDLNHDGYMDLIYARSNRLYVTSYNPNKAAGSRLINWPAPNFTIDSIDITVTLSASDLNGDGYPDLAIETHDPHMVYFYLNNKR